MKSGSFPLPDRPTFDPIYASRKHVSSRRGRRSQTDTGRAQMRSRYLLPASPVTNLIDKHFPNQKAVFT